MSNDFLPFAVGGSANVTPQSTYAANTTLTQGGFSSGIAKSPDLNKVWRQSSIMSAVVAQFVVNQTGQNAVDDGTTATLIANLLAAVRNAARQSVIVTGAGSANTYTATNAPALIALPSSGFIQQITIPAANTGASTFAPDGLTAKPILGLGNSALQGGELPANSVATLMYVIASIVNSGNGAWIILECTGGALQIAPATASQHAVQLGQVSGVVGQARRARMNTSAGVTSATVFAADEIVVETAFGGLRYCLANYSQTINLATTGAGGMDTGTAPTSGYVALYAIYNPTTNTQSILATNATASVVGNVYGGANMPAGYTASALISVWPTNASKLFVVGVQADRVISLGATSILSSSVTQASPIALSISSAVPPNAITVSGTMAVSSTAASNLSLSVFTSAASTGQQGANFISSAAGASVAIPYRDLQISTSQNLFYSSASTGGTPTFSMGVTGYSF